MDRITGRIESIEAEAGQVKLEPAVPLVGTPIYRKIKVRS